MKSPLRPFPPSSRLVFAFMVAALAASCGADSKSSPGAKAVTSARSGPLAANPSPAKRESKARIAALEAVEYDLVIRGGRVIDPETGFDAIASIGVVGDKIEAVSALAALKGKREIDASGKVVSPGFIDIDIPLYPTTSNYRGTEYWKLTDGVTSALWLHNGFGDVNVILKAVGSKPHAVNWAFGVRFTDYQDWYKTMPERLAALRKNIALGGLVVAGSPEYYPNVSADDMVAYAEVAKEFGMPVALHLRYSRKTDELKGVAEAIEVAERSGAKVHIFHLPSTGGTFNMAQALSMLESARARGVKIDADVYPYTYWMTFINSARFDPGWREGFGLDYEDLYYVPIKSFLDEASFAKARKAGGLAVVPEGTISMENSLLPALAKEWIFLASDGGYDFLPGSAPSAGHPRDTGNFAHALSLARTQGLDLKSLIRKMTLDPANFVAPVCEDYEKRGRIQEGAYADITVFDPATVSDSGTVENPAKESKGIEAVVVNGVLRWLGGKLEGKDSGRMMDRTGRAP